MSGVHPPTHALLPALTDFLYDGLQLLLGAQRHNKDLDGRHDDGEGQDLDVDQETHATCQPRAFEIWGSWTDALLFNVLACPETVFK